MNKFYVGQTFYYASSKNVVLPCKVYKYNPSTTELYFKTPESDTRCLVAKEYQLNVIFFNSREEAEAHIGVRKRQRYPNMCVDPSHKNLLSGGYGENATSKNKLQKEDDMSEYDYKIKEFKLD